VWDKNRLITVAIIIGLFGGLTGGPIASLIYYDSTPEERSYVFIIPEIIGFICAGLMIYVSKLKKKMLKGLSPGAHDIRWSGIVIFSDGTNQPEDTTYHLTVK
jgi:hypothetical protein